MCWCFLAWKMRNVLRNKCTIYDRWMEYMALCIYAPHLIHANIVTFGIPTMTIFVCASVCVSVYICVVSMYMDFVWCSHTFVYSRWVSVMSHQSQKRKERAILSLSQWEKNTSGTVKLLRKLISPEDSSFISVSNARFTWHGNVVDAAAAARHHPESTEPDPNFERNETSEHCEATTEWRRKCRAKPPYKKSQMKIF